MRRRRDATRIARGGAFDAAWYLRRYPDVAAAGVEPLSHFVNSGFGEGRFPNPIFDTAWYRATYLPGDATTNALDHYLRRGRRRGLRPNRWLDPAWYRERHALDAGIDPMAHYLSAGREAAAPGPDVALDDIVRAHPDLGGDGTPLGFFLNTYRVVGALDPSTSHYVAGWAARRAGPAIVLTVTVNGEPVGEVRPWISRPDVKRAAGLDGIGFCFRFPKRLAHGDTIGLRDDLGQALIGCEQTYLVPALDSTTAFYPNRAAIAATFLRGDGVEIGAFTHPNDLPPDREVAFFDRYPAETLRTFYDPDCGRPLMEPDYVGDAETLDALPETSFDFLIANHVIEHLQDPIHFLARVAAKLRPGGRAMITAPDKRYCMDRTRTLTPFEHLVEDHEKGPATTQRGHFVRYFIEAGGQDEATAEASTDACDMSDLRFHYHVWDADAFTGFVDAAIARYDLPLAPIHTRATEADVIVVLEKRDGSTPQISKTPVRSRPP